MTQIAQCECILSSNYKSRNFACVGEKEVYIYTRIYII